MQQRRLPVKKAGERGSRINPNERSIGMQEILVLIVIALVIFYFPRMMAKKSIPEPAACRMALTGWVRLAIVGSLLWVAATAVLLEPWQKEILPFLYFGLGPVIVLWGAAWVWSGYRRK
jgi:hypothetical protein